MSADQSKAPDVHGRVHVAIDNAEELVEASSAHGRGELEDSEYLERREGLLAPDPGGTSGTTTAAP